jgi:hypothetical protein
VEGNLAYISSTGGLRILDVTDPAYPTQLGILSGEYSRVSVSGNLAYLCAGTSGVAIVDVSDSFDPVLLSSFDTDHVAQAALAQDNYLFIADGLTGLIVMDVSDPSTPFRVATLGLADQSWDLALQGDYAYIPTHSAGLSVVDISNPLDPVLVSTLGGFALAKAVELSGDLAYVADNAGGMMIVDISDPVNLVVQSELAIPGWINDIVVQEGGYAFAANSYPDRMGLELIDVSDPEDPHLVGFAEEYYGCFQVSLGGEFVYSACGLAGLNIYDISNTSSAGALNFTDVPGGCVDIDLNGNLALIAGGDSFGSSTGGLQVLDISNPQSPELLGSVYIPEYAAQVVSEGTYAYVIDSYDNNGLIIVDIENPSDPVILSSFPTNSRVSGLDKQGDLVFLGVGADGLRIVDVSNPMNPVLVGFFPEHWASDLRVQGDYVYVLLPAVSNLLIVDISYPANPVQAGLLGFSGYPSNLEVVNDRVYMAMSWNGLSIVDVSNPAAPALLSNIDLPGQAIHVVLDSWLAYVSCTFGGLQIVDVSDDMNPSVLGMNPTADSAFSAEVGEGVIYMGDWWSGVHCILPQCLDETGAQWDPAPPSHRLNIYPNPFNPKTHLTVSLESASKLEMGIFDLAGRKVKTFSTKRLEAGEHLFIWDGCDDSGRRLASGVYLARSKVATGTVQRKVVLLK